MVILTVIKVPNDEVSIQLWYDLHERVTIIDNVLRVRMYWNAVISLTALEPGKCNVLLDGQVGPEKRQRHCSDRDGRTVKYLLIKTNAFVRIMFLFCVWDDIRSVKVCKTKLYRLWFTGFTDFNKVESLWFTYFVMSSQTQKKKLDPYGLVCWSLRQANQKIFTILFNVSVTTIDFFRIEFYRIYRTCRLLFLVIFIFRITIISILQNLQNL